MNTLDQAFEALKTFTEGSSRGALMPIDEAVRDVLDNPKDRYQLERRLLTALESDIPLLAKEYICRQLVLIGSADAVPVLARLMNHPDLNHAARAILESLPDPAANTALHRGLRSSPDLAKTGIINSLGQRRTAQSVSELTALLEDPNPRVAGAAAAALGQIGTTRAAHALKAYLPKSSPALLSAIADACLVCAEQLAGTKNRSQAIALYQALSRAALPPHITQAAQRGLQAHPR